MSGQIGNSSETAGSRQPLASAQTATSPVPDAPDNAQTSGIQLRALAAFAPIGIFQGDLNGNCIYTNQAWSDISGLTLEESLGSGWAKCLHPDDIENLGEEWRASVESGAMFQADSRLVRSSGEIRHIRVRGHHVSSPENGEPCFVGCAEDITDRKEFETRLESAAMTDQLTGLPNRNRLVSQFRDALSRRENGTEKFAVMFLDFDYFKTVNDSWGHDVGDELLRQIADRIREELDAIAHRSDQRIECTPSRFGGDEFVLLFNGIDGESEAESIAKSIHTKLAEPYQLGPYETSNNASIGIVVGPADYERAEDILRDADTAMYEAKRAGRNRYVFFDIAMHTQVRRRLQIKNDLRSLVNSRRISLNYQPIVSLQTGEISAVEALVRWKHQDLGWISPAEFIPIAQESELILELGEWVLREGCRQFAEWKSTLGQMAPRQVSINLARKQFGDPRMLDVIATVLNETGLGPRELQLEVTEDAFAMDVDDAVDTMRSIRELGVKLAIDDFGSGTSSFVALHRFPVDVLKIDRSLIKEIEVSSGEAAMLHGLVVMARNLDIKLVAEGIETSRQARAVQDLGCEFMQGYFFARPMPASDIDSFMIQNQSMDWCEAGAISFAQAWSERLAYHIAPRAERKQTIDPIW